MLCSPASLLGAQRVDRIDVSYLEQGRVTWNNSKSGARAATGDGSSIANDDDDTDGEEDLLSDEDVDGKSGKVEEKEDAEIVPSGGGVEEEKGGEPKQPPKDGDVPRVVGESGSTPAEMVVTQTAEGDEELRVADGEGKGSKVASTTEEEGFGPESHPQKKERASGSRQRLKRVRRRKGMSGGARSGTAASVAPPTVNTATTGKGGEGEEDEEEDKDIEGAVGDFSFATELFFLTHRALQVMVLPLGRRRNAMLKNIDDVALARTGKSAAHNNNSNSDPASSGTMLGVFKEAMSAVDLGWTVEGLRSDAIAGAACRFATFTAAWVERQIMMGDGGQDTPTRGGSSSSLKTVLRSSSPASSSPSEGPVDGDGSSGVEAAAVFARFPVALIDNMCESWMRAANEGPTKGLLTLTAADEAACFCGKLMEQVRLCVSAFFMALFAGTLALL